MKRILLYALVAFPALLLSSCNKEMEENVNGLTEKQSEMAATLESLKGTDAELDALIDAVEARVVTLEGKVADLESGVGDLETSVGNLESGIGDLETSVGDLETNVGDLETSIGAMQSEIATLKTSLETLQAMNKKIDATIKELEESIRTSEGQMYEFNNRLAEIEKFTSELEALKGQLEELGVIRADVEALKQSLAELVAADVDLSQLLSALTSRADDIEAEIEALKNAGSGGSSGGTDNPSGGSDTPSDNSQVEALETRVAELEGELDATNQAINNLTDSVTEVRNTIQSILDTMQGYANKTDLTALETELMAQINTVKSDVTALTNECAEKFGVIETDIETIQQSLTSLEEADKGVAGLISALEERATEIEADIEILENSVTGSIETVNSRMAELSEELTAVKTAIQNLQAKDSQIDAAIASLNDSMEASQQANEDAMAAIDADLAEQLAQIEGLSEILQQHIQTATTTFATQEALSGLSAEIAAMKEQYEAEFNLIKKDIADLVAMIQSMTPISKYDDGAAEGIFFSGPTDAENVALIEYNYIVRPAGAAEKLAQAWAENNDLMQFRGHYTVTRASFDFVDMEIKDVTASEDILTVTAYVDGISEESCNNVAYTERFSASLLVTDGKTDYSTDFVNLCCINTGYTLSNPECANCYRLNTGIVGARFKIQRGVNGGSFEESPYELHGVPTGTPHSADVLWESNGTVELTEVGSVVDPEIDIHNGYIYFQTPDSDKSGNAVIALRDENGDILWTWHIWRFNNPGTSYYDNYGYGYMNCNLGHVGETEGLMYQWGRKDPFLGTAWDSERQKPVAITSTLTWPEPVPSDTRFVSQVSYTVSNPTTFITANSINDHWFYLSSLPSEGYGVWYSDLNKKSDFDPCPPGYKVPSVDYQLLSSMNIQNLQWGVDTDAGTLSKDDRPDGWPVVADRAYAFTGYLSEDTGSIVSDRSFYWSCNVYESTLSYRCMEVDKDGYMKRVSTSAPGARGAYIRCMKME